jgi:hypothetical protein
VQPRLLALLLVAAALAAAAVPAAATLSTPAFTNYAMPANLANAHGAGEPSIGVNPRSGLAFFQAYTHTYSVAFGQGDPAWTDVTPVLPTTRLNNDPILFTDQRTGRTFAGGLYSVCSVLEFTDNDGQAWVPVLNACPFPSSDHPSVGGGPFHAPAPPTAAVYDGAVYVCQQSGTDRCVASLDGGITFGLPVAVQGDCHSFHGHIKVSADGTAYVPSAYCGSNQGGFASSDNGATWVSYHIPGTRVQSNGGGFDPSVATTPDNTVYEAWGDGVNNHPFIARSTDHGATWDRITDLAGTVSPPIVASTFQAVVAGDDGRVAVAYLASVDGNGKNPFGGDFAGSWDLYISFSYDAGQTWQTVKATTDPVQRGCIYDVITSPNCHRNLLDFMDATLGPNGEVLVAYADGCTSARCTGPGGGSSDSTDALGTIARQTGGAGLTAR